MRKIAFMLALAFPCFAWAGEPKELPEIIAFDGYAFAWQDNWKEKDAAKRGKLLVYDVVSAWHGKPVLADCGKFQTKLKGVTWCFKDEANRKVFETKTEQGDNDYIPFAGGRCTAGASWGLLGARGDPTTARVLKDPFGEKILVLQSNKKWWIGFKDSDLRRAMAIVNVASGPRIVPNEEMKKE